MGPEEDTWCEYCGTELTNRPHTPGCPALRVEQLEGGIEKALAILNVCFVDTNTLTKALDVLKALQKTTVSN